ncbi:MAG TPA: hypothetical protein DCY31_07425 [Ruminococcaceae bacterium]|nr:hypothetical protein [Oscillospiraceae bacterium]
MAKKLISIVLSVILVFSTFVIGSFAGDTITDDDRAYYPEEELAITDPKERIDIVFLSGKFGGGGELVTEAADKETLEYNLKYWDDEIINEYHALEAKGTAATDEEWGALYRKMKTPRDNDDEWKDFFYEYRREDKANANVRLVPSKTDLKPGEEFTVDVYLTTDFYFSISQLKTTFFYNNTLVDMIGCDEKNKGTDDAHKGQDPSEMKQHPIGPYFSDYATYDEMPHVGDYTYGSYVESYGDMRELEWPESILAIDNWQNTMEAYLFMFDSRDDVKIVPALKPQDELLLTLKMKVKDDAKVGSTTQILAPGDAMYSSAKELFYEEMEAQDKPITPYWQFVRVNPKENSDDLYMADYLTQYDQTITSTPATINIVGDDVQKADYTALDAAIAGFDASVSGLYTAATWNAYASAVTAGTNVSRDLLIADQAIVDAATKAITDAKAALALNKLVSADVIGTPTIGSAANVQVVANGSPAAIRLVNTDGNALTFNRDDATITANGDNEVWNIKVSVSSATTNYNVFGKWGEEFSDAGLALTINATEGLDLSVHSIVVPDMYPTGTYTDGRIYAGIHTVIVKTSTDVHKLQFVDPYGNTRTFDKATWTPVVEGDELVWTIQFNFAQGVFNFAARTRAVNTTFALTGDYITGRALYY